MGAAAAAAGAGAPAAGYGPGPSQVPADTESRVPVINLKDGTRLAGDDAPRRRELDQWLREQVCLLVLVT